MAITAQDVVTPVREDVSDEIPDQAGAYRWSDAKIFRYIMAGRRAFFREFPESKYTDTDIVLTPADGLPPITALNTRLNMASEFLERMVHYVDYRILQGDSENAGEDQLAIQHFKQTGLKFP
jgi:hypothetical protein